MISAFKAKRHRRRLRQKSFAPKKKVNTSGYRFNKPRRSGSLVTKLPKGTGPPLSNSGGGLSPLIGGLARLGQMGVSFAPAKDEEDCSDEKSCSYNQNKMEIRRLRKLIW